MNLKDKVLENIFYMEQRGEIEGVFSEAIKMALDEMNPPKKWFEISTLNFDDNLNSILDIDTYFDDIEKNIKDTYIYNELENTFNYPCIFTVDNGWELQENNKTFVKSFEDGSWFDRNRSKNVEAICNELGWHGFKYYELDHELFKNYLDLYISGNATSSQLEEKVTFLDSYIELKEKLLDGNLSQSAIKNKLYDASMIAKKQNSNNNRDIDFESKIER